ncbi:hypothetical protein A2572_02030 [Candidatus Collierbacteria bacterium RIFOXYD1_FULL_40_9]|uniref:DNA 3'-5' helicase n=1 Tax=Candidatus Collierbacteria bacterium RIFOXYD1_FULL_40_9 TaxID=1817731 RepID=A0A1F5FTC4_9BACT|nr:MAG: hypothetical protein A2572_02030 [Candidatus Collierbacteria bacterium RIFOXYD1_FULL_40_9]
MRIDELNTEQQQAVDYKTGPLLVLAGAGSGKTKVLVHRVVSIIENQKVSPNKIALLTFTNKAAEEMKKRIGKLLGVVNENLGFVGTFHSFCVKLLREYGEILGIPRNFVVFDSEDSEVVMKEVIKEMKLDTSEINPRMFLSLIGKAKNDLTTPALLVEEKNNYFYKNLVMAWSKYQEKLKRNRALDFDDLLVKSVELFKMPTVSEEINKKLEWILVDEYQDTNKAQFELTKYLAGEKKNLTVVGDSSQAIYSFRGADFRNLLLLEEQYPEIYKINLPKNYRSTQNILDGAYGVVSNNTSHPTIRLIATNDEGEKIRLIESEDEKQEAKRVVFEANIQSAFSEVAILYRVNSLSRALEEELVRRSIPYKLVGGVRFYGRAEIKDLISYLRLMINKEEEVSKKRAEKIGKRRLVKFFDWLNSKNPAIVDSNVGETLNEIMNEVDFLSRYDDRDQEDQSRIENINELLAVASLYSSVESFLESAALAESEAKKAQSSAKITLMTVHAAKGLEFGAVYIVGLEEGLFPHSRSIALGSKEEIEEERRLMYVAMTRAKTKLTLSFARSRLIFGGRMRSIPSRFLSEISPTVLDKKWTEETGDITAKAVSKEKVRRIVSDWEIDLVTKDDFADIDGW